MRIGYLSSRLIVIVNVMGIILCLSTSAWIYLTHTDLTPEKNERVFQKNIKEANRINDIDEFRQVHQSILLAHKRKINLHYHNVKPIIWLSTIAILIFALDTYIFWQLVRAKSIRIR